MKKLLLILALASVFAFSSEAQELTDEQKIKQALSAAPPSIAEGATVMEWVSKRVLKQDTNGYICFPTLLGGPPYPMCIEEQWMKFLEAYTKNEEPPRRSKIAIGYWLQGAPPMSNEDPYATTPETAAKHVMAPGEPHLAILFPDPKMLDEFPTDPKQGGPWVMWKGTPYVHLMVPAPGVVAE